MYTAEQAARGEVLYKGQRTACHGDDLAGTNEGPALAGGDFLGFWDQGACGWRITSLSRNPLRYHVGQPE